MEGQSTTLGPIHFAPPPSSDSLDAQGNHKVAQAIGGVVDVSVMTVDDRCVGVH